MAEHDCDGCHEETPCEDCLEARRLREMKGRTTAFRTQKSYPPSERGMFRTPQVPS